MELQRHSGGKGGGTKKKGSATARHALPEEGDSA